MITPDIADLLKELNRGCIYMNDSNIDYIVNSYKTDELLTKAANTLECQAAEIERLRRSAGKSNDEVCQVLGKALGYPWFKDDISGTFPNATEKDGVCIGDHVAESIADEAAAEIKKLREEVRYLRNTVSQTQSDICPVDPTGYKAARSAFWKVMNEEGLGGFARATLKGEEA